MAWRGRTSTTSSCAWPCATPWCRSGTAPTHPSCTRRRAPTRARSCRYSATRAFALVCVFVCARVCVFVYVLVCVFVCVPVGVCLVGYATSCAGEVSCRCRVGVVRGAADVYLAARSWVRWFVVRHGVGVLTLVCIPIRVPQVAATLGYQFSRRTTDAEVVTIQNRDVTYEVSRSQRVLVVCCTSRPALV